MTKQTNQTNQGGKPDDKSQTKSGGTGGTSQAPAGSTGGATGSNPNGATDSVVNSNGNTQPPVSTAGSGGDNSGNGETDVAAQTATQPTAREKIDGVLATLPGEHKDPEAVITGLKFAFGDEVTAEDETAVREKVKAPEADKTKSEDSKKESKDEVAKEDAKPISAEEAARIMTQGTEMVPPKDPHPLEDTKKRSYRATGGGPLNNPYTNDNFTGEASKPVVEDSWIKMQIREGKMARVEEE